MALDEHGLRHAFGGALALAYCIRNPRGTIDIDVNVFIGPGRLAELLAALPPEVSVTREQRSELEERGQARLWWDSTPVDVFLSNHPFHDHVESRIRRVPFAELSDLPVLSCSDLAVFKAFFGRAKDGLDVGEMVVAGSVDRDELEVTITAMLGEGERRRFFGWVDETVVDARRPEPRFTTNE